IGDKQTIYNLYYVMTKIIATPTANIIIGEVSNWGGGGFFFKKKKNFLFFFFLKKKKIGKLIFFFFRRNQNMMTLSLHLRNLQVMRQSFLQFHQFSIL